MYPAARSVTAREVRQSIRVDAHALSWQGFGHMLHCSGAQLSLRPSQRLAGEPRPEDTSDNRPRVFGTEIDFMQPVEITSNQSQSPDRSGD
jgi:hypothetical protein